VTLQHRRNEPVLGADLRTIESALQTHVAAAAASDRLRRRDAAPREIARKACRVHAGKLSVARQRAGRAAESHASCQPNETQDQLRR
jgi:hypothetical protein